MCIEPHFLALSDGLSHTLLVGKWWGGGILILLHSACLWQVRMNVSEIEHMTSWAARKYGRLVLASGLSTFLMVNLTLHAGAGLHYYCSHGERERERVRESERET